MKPIVRLAAVVFLISVLTPAAGLAAPEADRGFVLLMEADRADDELTLSFTLGAPEPTSWRNFLIIINPSFRVYPLWSVPLPALPTPVDFSFSVPFPLTGSIAIYSILATATGTKAYDLKSCHGPYPTSRIEGYGSKTTVVQGGEIDFHISTDSPTYDIQIFRTTAPPFGYEGPPVTTIPALPGSRHPIPLDSFRTGCGWPVSYTLSIPSDWPSGVYFAQLVIPTGHVTLIPFVVREDDPGSTSTILFLDAVNTHNSYNTHNGKNAYYDIDFLGVLPPQLIKVTRSYTVSFDRPLWDDFEFEAEHYSTWEMLFVLWLESEGYTVEFCSDHDLHRNPDLLNHYSLLVMAGHVEYWTREMRENVDAFVDRGGNLAIFGGNTCWWQVRLEDDERTQVIYKDKYRDPLYGLADDLVTVNWYDDPVLEPENTLTGVSYRNGGYVDFFDILPASEGYGGLEVMAPEHWVFEGTGLAHGDIFGYEGTIAGPEVDGVLLEWIEGRPYPIGGDGTPPNFEILAITPSVTEWSTDAWGTMGLYTRGTATVFNGATIEWPDGLAADPNVATNTRNVIERLR